jgi:Flp pilus assembly protein TadB
MFISPVGWVLIGIAAGLLAVGNIIIRRMTAIA